MLDRAALSRSWGVPRLREEAARRLEALYLGALK